MTLSVLGYKQDNISKIKRIAQSVPHILRNADADNWAGGKHKRISVCLLRYLVQVQY